MAMVQSRPLRDLRTLLLAAFLAITGLSGCGNEQGSGNGPDVSAASIHFDPVKAVLPVNGEQEIFAHVQDQYGKGLAGVRIEWIVGLGNDTDAAIIPNGNAGEAHRAEPIVGDRHTFSRTDQGGNTGIRLRAGKEGQTEIIALLPGQEENSSQLARIRLNWADAKLEYNNRATATGDHATLEVHVVRASDGRPLDGDEVHWQIRNGTAKFKDDDGNEFVSRTDESGLARAELVNPAGEVATSTLAFTVTRPDNLENCRCNIAENRVAQGDIALEWHASPPQETQPTERPTTHAKATARPPHPRLKLELACPEAVDLGDGFQYQLRIVNHGPGRAGPTMIEDLLPQSVRHNIGKDRLLWRAHALSPGQNASTAIQVAAVQAGESINTARIAGQEKTVTCTTLIRRPDLVLTKNGPATRYLGQSLSYNIAVGNRGNTTAHKVSVTDIFPKGASYLKSQPKGELDETDKSIQWDLGDIAAGTEQHVAVVLRADAPGRVCNVAKAQDTITGEIRTESCTDLKGLVAMHLEVTDAPDPILLGATTTYRIEVLNQGSATATQVAIYCRLPKELAFVSADGPTNALVDGTSIRFTTLAGLAPHEKVIYQVTAKALAEGDVRFATEITANELSTPVRETESTRLYK